MIKRKVWNLKGLIISKLRRIFFFSPLRRSALLNAFVKKNRWRCAGCKKTTNKPKVDHILPVIDTKMGWQGWDVFITRLFCAVENLQVLCERCHNKKTKLETKERKKK